MMRRILTALAMVVAATAVAVPTANAGPARTAQCPGSYGTAIGVKVALSDVPVTNTTASAVQVTVTFPAEGNGGTFGLSSADPSRTLTDATWCVKSALTISDPVFGSGLSGISPATNKRGITQKIGYVILYTATTTAPASQCYDSDSFYLDLRLTGPIDAGLNGTVYASVDGTCTDNAGPAEIVSGATFGEAVRKCNDRNILYDDALRLSEIGYSTAPANWWLCG